jgi:hypothetical protein
MRAKSATIGISLGAATGNMSEAKVDGKHEFSEFIKVLLRAKQGVSGKVIGGYTTVAGNLKLKDRILKIANDFMERKNVR